MQLGVMTESCKIVVRNNDSSVMALQTAESIVAEKLGRYQMQDVAQ